MSGDALYLVGRPGAGKSTLMAHLTRRLVGFENTKPVAHIDYGGDVIQLGRARKGFPGTDTLSMGALPVVVRWLSGPAAPATVLGEGDRLATVKFFDAVRAAGYDLTVVAVVSPDDVVERRRAARVGWSPNPVWLAGRDTKSANLAAVADVVVPGDDLDAAQAALAHLTAVQRLEEMRAREAA